jgi:hypothetical protein
MTTKLFEIRDRGTLVPALAIQVSKADGWLMERAGFGETPMVYLIMLATEHCAYDPFHWPNQRTMGNAHRYIEAHYDELENGAVVDVEYILGERGAPKVSEAVLYR